MSLKTKELTKLSEEELTIAVDLTLMQYDLYNPTYEEIADLVSQEFNCVCSSRDIWALSEPNVSDLELDAKLIYSNVGL